MRYFKRGFTLIEILTVIAIMGVLAMVILGLKPGNPRGLDDAVRVAELEFTIARNKAVMGINPDPRPDENPRYNIRSGVLVLNDPEDPERHLRYIQQIIGGTTSATSTDLNDYVWYASGEPVRLPSGVYFVPPTSTIKGRSKIIWLESSHVNGEVLFTPERNVGGRKLGVGQKWFMYIFDTNGQTYMQKAVFMVGEGKVNGATGEVSFDETTPLAGFIMHRSGAVSVMKSNEEAEKAVE